MTREKQTAAWRALARPGAVAALVLISLALAIFVKDAASRRADTGAGPEPRKVASDILDGDDGPTNPKLGTVPTLPGACPILGDCAPPDDEASGQPEQGAVGK